MADLPEAAKAIITVGKGYKVWIFRGDLGSGKTTLVKSILDFWGIEDNVRSPSYAIVNEYSSKDGETIYHFDFFRINDIREALDIGVDEYLESGSHCLIEWPEIMEPLLPESFFEIKIENPKNTERIFKLKKYG